jgi:hypothetical protein
MPEPTQQISIRLPTALLQEIETIAQNANIPRSQAIIETLQRGLGHVTQPESQPNHDGAIEELRCDLRSAIERIENLERVTKRDPVVIRKARQITDDLTQKAVLATIGVSRSTARDRAKKAGLSLAEWIEANSRYRRSGKLWISQLAL